MQFSLVQKKAIVWVLSLLLCIGMGTCYGVVCKSNWRLRAEFVHGITLPSSTTDLENIGGTGFGSRVALEERFESRFSINRKEFRSLITQFDGGNIRDRIAGDSIWYFGKTNPDSSNGYEGGWPRNQSGFMMYDPPTGADYVVLACDSVSDEKLHVILISEWN
jgi:hypothetical protein